MKVHNLVVTGSLTSGGENISTISSSVADTITNVSSSISASINDLSSSMEDMVTNMSSSFDTTISTLATTGSNLFVGTQTISGSIIPAVNNTYDLGTATQQFRDLYLSSASLYIDGVKVLGSTAQELQITTDAGQSFKILEAGSDTITLQSNDGNITLATSGGGDVILDPTSGIVALKGTTTIYAGNRVLSSDGNAIQFGNSVTMTGSLVVTGFIETQELRTTYISSSILYRSGSTKFGDELSDTHDFTGSLNISGSVNAIGSGLVSGSSQISYSGLSEIPSGIVSGSGQITLSSTNGFGTYIDQPIKSGSTVTFAGLNTISTTGAPSFGNGINIITQPGTYTAGHGGILQFQNEDVITAGIRGVRDPGSWASALLFYTHTASAGNTFGTTFTEKMRLSDAGNLSVVGNIKTDGVINWNGTVGALSYGGGAVTMETNTAVPILLKTNGTTAITISTGQTVTFASDISLGGNILTGVDKAIRFDSSGASGHPEIGVDSSANLNFKNTAGTTNLTLSNGGNLTVGGSITTSAGLNSTKNVVAGEATPLHLSYSSSDGTGPAMRFGGGQGFWDIQPSNNNQRISFEWSDSVNTLSLMSDGRVGINDTNPSRKLAVNFGTSVNDGLIVYGSQRLNTVFQSTGEHCFIYMDSHHANTFLPKLHFQRSSTTYGLIGLERASNSDAIGAYAESEMVVGSTTTVPLSLQTNGVRRIRMASGGGVEVFNSLSVSGNLTARNFNKFIKTFVPAGSTGSGTSVTYNWADELAALAGNFDSGGYYKGFLRSGNGAHYYGYHFDILVGSIGYGGNSLQYKVQNIVSANAPWVGGCGFSPFGTVDTTGFVHNNNPCGEVLELFITKLGG